MKILAVKWRALGDTVIWSSALDALHQMDHQYQIDLLYPAMYHPLFSSDRRFNSHFATPKTLSSWFQTVKTLRQNRYDAILDFHSHTKSHLLTQLLRSNLCLHHPHKRVKHPSPKHPIPHLGIPTKATQRDVNVVKALGWNGVPPDTKINPSSSIIELGTQALLKTTLNLQKPILFISVGASRPSKFWPLENYLELVRKLSNKYQIALLFQNLLDFRDRPGIKREFETMIPCIHTPTLELLMGVLGFGKFYMGSDSGVKHLAAALGLKTLTLFGPESIGEWHCYPQELHPTIQIEVGCRDQNPKPKEFAWCAEFLCPLGSHACMQLIDPQTVAQKLELLMKC